SSRRRHTRFSRDWSSDVCSSDLGVSGRREAAQAVALRLRDLEPRDELLEQLPGHLAAAGQRLQPLVGIRDAVTAHHGLERLGEHLVAVREVGLDALAIRLELAEPLLTGVEREQAVAER